MYPFTQGHVLPDFIVHCQLALSDKGIGGQALKELEKVKAHCSIETRTRAENLALWPPILVNRMRRTMSKPEWSRRSLMP